MNLFFIKKLKRFRGEKIMKKNVLNVVMMAVLSFLMLTACSSKKEDTAKPAEKIVLTIGMWGSSPEETALVDNQIKAFQVKYPNIEVKKQVSVGDYGQELQANFAANTEPDIFYVDSADSLAYIDKKAIVSLDEYLDKSQLGDYNKVLLDAFSKEGKVYGLPKDYNPLVMFVNTDMLEKAGAKVPTTWAELEVTLEQLKKAGAKGLLGKDFKYPMSVVNGGERVAAFALQNGGNIYNIEKDVLELNSPEVAGGYDFQYNLIRKGLAEAPVAMGDGWSGDSFARNKVAIVYEGGWLVPFMRSAGPNVKYQMVNLPKGQKDATMMFTVAYSMGRNTKYPKESVQLMEFLTGVEAQQMTIETGLGLPSRTSLEATFTTKYPERKALIDMTKVATPFRFGINGRKVNDALTKVGEALYLESTKGTNNVKTIDLLNEAAK